MNSKEIQILDLDIKTAILFVISIFVSIFLTIEKKRELEGKKRILSKKNDQYISLINRLFVLGIVLVILYDNYLSYQVTKEKNEDPKLNIYQIVASIFGVLSAIIILYVTINSFDNQDFSLENIVF